MNQALGNAGKTVIYTDPVEAEAANQIAALKELVDDMRAARWTCCVIIGGNPVYDAPADLDFARRYAEGGRGRIYHGLYVNETARLCALAHQRHALPGAVGRCARV